MKQREQPEPKELGQGYLFSEKARRALFFAKYNAFLRNTDEETHHITISDIRAGIAKEEHK